MVQDERRLSIDGKIHPQPCGGLGALLICVLKEIFCFEKVNQKFSIAGVILVIRLVVALREL